MTKEELARLLAEAADPDKSPMALSTLNTHIGTLMDTLDSMTASNTLLEERVKGLQDTNMALFLRTNTQMDDPEEEKELTDDEIFDNLFTKKVIPEYNK